MEWACADGARELAQGDALAAPRIEVGLCFVDETVHGATLPGGGGRIYPLLARILQRICSLLSGLQALLLGLQGLVHLLLRLLQGLLRLLELLFSRRSG